MMKRQPAAVNNEKFEKLMKEIGDFGKFQKRLCFLLVLGAIPNGYFAMSIVFIGRTPPSFRCFVPGGDHQYSNEITTIASEFITSDSRVEKTTTENNYTDTAPGQNKCALPEDVGSNSTNVIGCPYGYVYDFEEGRSSIVTEWGLVCDRAWIMPLIMSIYMCGVLVGSLLSGTASDRFGRYPTFIVGTLLMYVFLGLCGAASSPPVFAALLFLAGCFAFLNYVSAFVIAAEIINTKNRVVIGTLTIGGFAGGYMLLPVFAYFIGNWRILCVVLAALGVFYIPYIWLITESPRWLYSKGKKEEFCKLFFTMAEMNGVSELKAKDLIENFFSDNETLLHNGGVTETERAPRIANEQYSYFDLLRHGAVRSRTLCMWLTWFACSVVYYGVALNTSNMGGNPYVNCFVAAAVEIPAYAMVIVLLRWRGRKPILLSTLLVAGLACSAVPYLKQINNNLAITFAMIGKLSITASFSIIYIVCSELFPTLMRSMGVGSSSMFARVGGIVAPYLLYLGDYYKSAPYLIMGIIGVVAAACNIVLPETGGIPLPETIEDLDPIVCPFRLCVKLKKRKEETIFSQQC